jgi:hypothetical protein
MTGLNKLQLPGLDLGAAKRMANSAMAAVKQEQLGYALICATKPDWRAGNTESFCVRLYTGGYMAMLLNVGRMDRALRVVLGIGLGIAGIFVNGHPYLGWALGIAGASVILSGTCGIWLTYRVLGLSTKKHNN